MFSSFILEITKKFPANIRKDIDRTIQGLVYQPIWQTIEWQTMLQETGYVKRGFFVGIYEEQKLLAYALVEKRSVGLWQHGFFCIGGPIVCEARSTPLLSETMRKLSEKEGVAFIQTEPLSEVQLPDFRAGHYKNFIEKHTAIIDLTQEDEAILSRMKPKGRYNIRIAEKAGVTIEQVPFSEEHLDTFYAILSETLERDSFSANSREYFRVFLRYLEKQELGGLFFAKREGEIIATGIFIFYKKTALYYYGASSSDNTKRKYMASYLLQWEAIQEAKKRGCEVFDFLGIADPIDPKSPLAGVTDFKLKLTDETKVWPVSQILPIKKIPFLLLWVRKVLKTLKNDFFKRFF